MPEPLDARLRDDEALDEIELVTHVMIEASEAEGPLTQVQVDRILGIQTA